MLSLTLAIALTATQTAPKPSAAPATGWTFKQSSDPAQPKSASATARAADGSRLLVRCDTAAQPIVSIQFMPKPALPAGDPRTVTVTLDNAQADMTTWQFPGLGAYNGEAAEVFLLADELAKAKTIRISLPEGEQMVERDFVGPGGDAMFRQVYAVCGFPYAMPAAKPAK